MNRGSSFQVRRISSSIEIVFGASGEFRFAPHFHDDWVLPIVAEGAMASVYERREVVFRAGLTDLLEPGTVHTGGPVDGRGWSYVGLSFGAALVARLEEELGYRERQARGGPVPFGSPVSAAALAAGLRIGGADGEAADQATYVLAKAMLTTGKGTRACGRDSGPRMMNVIRDYLSANLSEPVRLDHLVALTGLSRTHIVRSFRDVTGLPPLAWRRQYRVAVSRKELRQGQPVVRVAADLGFADQAHFTRWFRASVGVTPAAYAAGWA